MTDKRSRFKLGVITGAILGIIYGYGAGRALKFNPVNIYRIWEARQFEKKLSREVSSGSAFRRFLVTDWGFQESLKRARAYNDLFGEKGLAEFNGQKGIQAEEYNLAIQKITGKDVKIKQYDIRNKYGLDVVESLIWSRLSNELENAVNNWDTQEDKKQDNLEQSSPSPFT
jgi:hypothetical protein